MFLRPPYHGQLRGSGPQPFALMGKASNSIFFKLNVLENKGFFLINGHAIP